MNREKIYTDSEGNIDKKKIKSKLSGFGQQSLLTFFGVIAELIKRLGFAFNNFRFSTTFRLHQKMTRMRWYKGWHERKYYKHVHVAVLSVYLLSLLVGIISLPVGVEAAWSNNKTWTTKSDFENGATLPGVLVSGDNDPNDANDNDAASLQGEQGFSNTISSGDGFALAVKSDGTLWSSGNNTNGALGVGDVLAHQGWLNTGVTNVKEVSAYYHSLILKNDGTVWGSGYNSNGKLGDGTLTSRSSFVQSKKSAAAGDYLTNIKKIIATDENSYALSNDNRLYAVGHNLYYQLGTGLNTPTYSTYWQEVTSANTVLDMAAGARDVMILKTNGATGKNEIWSLGSNIYGELGLGHTNQVTTWTKSAIPDNVTAIYMGQFHAAATVDSGTDIGTVYTVGYGADYRLGLGDSVNRSTWTMTGMSNVKYVLVSSNATFAIKNDASTWAVGYNGFGNLGVGDRLAKAIWTPVQDNNIRNISSGPTSTTLFLKNNGDLYAVGFGAYDIFPVNKLSINNTYTPTQTDTNISAIDTSYNGTSYIKNGYAYAAGYNWDCRLGFSDAWHKENFTLLPINNVSKIESSEANTYVIKSDKTLWGIGINSTGQLAVGNTNFSFPAFQQARIDASNYLLNVEQVSAGVGHAIAMTTSGDVYAIGNNVNGQLGDGTTTNALYWKLVGTGASKVFAGRIYSAILKTDGTLQMVGNNIYGEYGIGTTATTVTAWTTTATGVLDFYGGQYHSHIKKADGIYGAGFNPYGALGDGSFTNKSTWTKLTGIDASSVSTVTSSYYNSSILYTDGTLYSAGYNYYGQLGLGDYSPRASFTQVPVTGVTKVSMGLSHTVIHKSDGSLLLTGSDIYGQFGRGRQLYADVPVLSAGLIRQPAPYNLTGEISGLKINAGMISRWVNVLWDASLPVGTTLKVRTRGASTEAGLASASWSGWKTASGDSLSTPNSQWLEVSVAMESTDGAFTPIVKSLSITYYTDVEAPANPTGVKVWDGSQRSVEYADAVWNSDNSVYFDWSAAVDVGSAGIKGYWVYLGTDPTADPKTAGVFQTDTSYTGNFVDTDSGTSYYLCISAEDNAQNRFVSQVEPYYQVLTYRFDKTAPRAPSYVAVNPAGWSTQNNFNFTWPAATDNLSNGDSSGVIGYQYKREGGGDSWSSTITGLTVDNITSYQSGQNIFSVRSVDAAGNYSTSTQVNYYYNADAPTAPTGVAAAPQSSTDNAFNFSWSQPTFANGGVKGYYYSVNATPNAKNSVFTTSTTTSTIPAATQQGFNTFYVVAIDNTDNINWGSYAAIQFECNTAAPGIPLKPEVFDTSNRDLQKYSVAVNWSEPTYKGVGFKDYQIERSVDGVSFDIVGSSSGTSYIDTGLLSAKYYYRVLARDNSGNISAPSEVVFTTPTGRYTSAPKITVEPEVAVKVSTATIRWVTDRNASSFVEIGENDQYGLTQGQFDFVSDHHVNLAGLKPETTYHYRVKFVDEDGNIGYSADKTLQTQPAPRVERVAINDVRLYTAVLTWYTSEPAESNLVYGKNTNYGSEIKNVSGGATTVHSVRLEGLDHSSNYHFAVRIKDMDGNEVLSDDYTFETQKFPVIAVVRMESVQDRASATMRVTWQTNVPTNSVVEYTPFGGNQQEVVKTKLETSHDMLVTGLFDNTNYIVVAKSIDQFGNMAVSDVQRYRTDYDTRPPVLSDISYEISSTGYGVETKNQVVVYWESDEPATSQIEYGLGLTGDYNSKTMEDAALGTSHVVVISDLKPSTSYHLRAVSRDGSRNEGFSEETTVLTEQAKSSILEVVIQTLQHALGWMFGA